MALDIEIPIKCSTYKSIADIFEIAILILIFTAGILILILVGCIFTTGLAGLVGLIVLPDVVTTDMSHKIYFFISNVYGISGGIITVFGLLLILGIIKFHCIKDNKIW